MKKKKMTYKEYVEAVKQYAIQEMYGGYYEGEVKANIDEAMKDMEYLIYLNWKEGEDFETAGYCVGMY